MRFFVCSGIERAAGELFKAAETVPGVRPRWSAMVLRVTRGSERRGCFFLDDWVIYAILRASAKTNVTNSIFCPQRALGGFGATYRFHQVRCGRQSVGYLFGVYLDSVKAHPPFTRYSKSHRDLKLSEHVPDQTRTGSLIGGPGTEP